jgi:predicted nuclease of predicted toxin-antitoxin system
MSYQLLLNENIEHEVLHRLEDNGHDVEHVEFVSQLGKGANDIALARYSVTTNRTIVTYDDDFIKKVPLEQYRAVLFIEDFTIPACELAEIIHSMAQIYPHDQMKGLQKTGREWL